MTVTITYGNGDTITLPDVCMIRRSGPRHLDVQCMGSDTVAHGNVVAFTVHTSDGVGERGRVADLERLVREAIHIIGTADDVAIPVVQITAWLTVARALLGS
jgi:hypothetical protein